MVTGRSILSLILLQYNGTNLLRFMVKPEQDPS